MPDNYAVIFDMDGVLVDTYRAHYESWLTIARAEGVQLTEEEFARTFGRTSREIIANTWGTGYSDADVAALDDRKEAAFRELIVADFPAMPGVHELLRSLHDEGFKLAVGSSGPPENVATVVDRIGQRELFAALVTATDVTRGKPDPQVFLIAAARLGIAPARCAVVEDAPLGITAALAAGMTAVGLASTGHTRESLVEAAAVVDSLRELSPDLFRRLIDGRPGRS